MSEAQKYGTLELAKIENMRLQHDDLTAGRKARSTDDLEAVEKKERKELKMEQKELKEEQKELQKEKAELKEEQHIIQELDEKIQHH